MFTASLPSWKLQQLVGLLRASQRNPNRQPT